MSASFYRHKENMANKNLTRLEGRPSKKEYDADISATTS